MGGGESSPSRAVFNEGRPAGARVNGRAARGVARCRAGPRSTKAGRPGPSSRAKPCAGWPVAGPGRVQRKPGGRVLRQGPGRARGKGGGAGQGGGARGPAGACPKNAGRGRGRRPTARRVARGPAGACSTNAGRGRARRPGRAPGGSWLGQAVFNESNRPGPGSRAVPRARVARCPAGPCSTNAGRGRGQRPGGARGGLLPGRAVFDESRLGPGPGPSAAPRARAARRPTGPCSTNAGRGRGPGQVPRRARGWLVARPGRVQRTPAGARARARGRAARAGGSWPGRAVFNECRPGLAGAGARVKRRAARAGGSLPGRAVFNECRPVPAGAGARGKRRAARAGLLVARPGRVQQMPAGRVLGEGPARARGCLLPGRAAFNDSRPAGAGVGVWAARAGLLINRPPGVQGRPGGCAECRPRCSALAGSGLRVFGRPAAGVKGQICP